MSASFGEWPEADAELLEMARTVAGVDPDAAALLRSGIGLHHGGLPRIVRQAVETAARKNWLRCVVCTPTLLEGVDFPTRTVIAAYPPQTRRGHPEVARLRNLAGRAGRGGRFSSGTLVVMAEDETGAKKWLRAFRAALPPTRSGLTQALEHMRNVAASLHVLELGDDAQRPTDAVDGLVLAAVAEGAVTDGDLRAALEKVLGRTLWSATTHPSIRDYTLDVATRRAGYVARAVGGSHWSRAFYRSGLPVASCIALRDALEPNVRLFEQAMDSLGANPDDWLLWLSTAIAPHLKELGTWAALSQHQLRDALGRWLGGQPLDEIAVAHPEVWPAIENDLDTLLPWVITGAIEFAAAHVQRADIRDLAHRRLAISRLRYGVPRIELTDIVRRGYDRVLVTRLADQYDKEPIGAHLFQSLTEYVTERSQWVINDENAAGGDDERLRVHHP